MKKLIKTFSVVFIVVILSSIIILPANAAGYTSEFQSSAATAGSWKSDSTHNVSTTFSKIYGGDVGIWFYMANAGLSNAFVRSTSRNAYVELLEKDPLVNDIAQKYTEGFGLYNGFYRTITTTNTYTNAGVIEYDNTAELFMKFKVDTISGDTSQNVASNVITYRFWYN
ncbi:MAG: hypothetical protein ACOX45_01970 [Acutalibacteraceae bacterium]